MAPLVIDGMHGLGDNLYQRAVAKKVAEPFYLSTPWPQIYADLPHVTCLKPNSKLRTQGKNEQRPETQAAFAAGPPKRQRPTRWHYLVSPDQSILESLGRQIGASGPFDMAGPVFEIPPEIKRPYIVVRPVCHRAEWTSDARSPQPEYIAAAIEELRKDFTIVSVADLEGEREWALEPLPYADITLHRGEFHVERLLGLIRGAAGLVGGVGWLVPAALAYKVPLLLIYGGWGFSNGPHRLFGPDVDRSFIEQVMPDAFCICNSNRHRCNKHITGFEARARTFALRLVRESSVAAGGGHRLVSGRGATV